MESNPITFDHLPAYVYQLGQMFDDLLEILRAKNAINQPDQDKWFNLEEFCQYHPAKPAPTTVYGWVSRRAVPHKRDGKHLFFLKSEIDAWLKQKGRKTSAEVELLAAQHTLQGRKGGRKIA